MARLITYEVPTDTSLFTPLQLQPRAACTFGMVAWARWLREYWIPFPRLIEEEKLGVVIAGLGVEYLRPFGFADSDTLVATAALQVRSNGGLLSLVTTLAPPEGKDVARVTGVLRPVKIADGEVLAAVPMNLDATTIGRFHDDEIVPDVPRRRLRPVLAELEAAGPPVAVERRTFTLHRHLCETADQWSGIALPDLTSEVRECLVVRASREIDDLTAGLTQPMRSIAMEFRRPAFFLDEFSVECSAYDVCEGVEFVHRFTSSAGDLMATVLESFPQAHDGGKAIDKGGRR